MSVVPPGGERHDDAHRLGRPGARLLGEGGGHGEGGDAEGEERGAQDRSHEVVSGFGAPRRGASGS
jgi:hypothetical protein